MTCYNSNNKTIHPHTFHALYAARLSYSIGRYAASRYLAKRSIPFALYRLALQLMAGEKVKTVIVAGANKKLSPIRTERLSHNALNNALAFSLSLS